MRTSPNIIITGTPGVGKTTHCEQLAASSGLTHLDVNKVVKERDCEDGFDEELKSVIVDEDKVADSLQGREISHGTDATYSSWTQLNLISKLADKL